MVEAFEYWSNRSLKDLHWAVTVLASDIDAFLDTERKAILQVATLTLGKLANGEINIPTHGNV